MLFSVLFDIVSAVCIIYTIVNLILKHIFFPSHAIRKIMLLEKKIIKLVTWRLKRQIFMYGNISMHIDITRLCKLLMNKLFWKYFSEHKENCFLLFLQYLYENASDGISCRNEAAFILITLNKILIKSSQTASNQCCNLISIRNSIPI